MRKNQSGIKRNNNLKIYSSPFIKNKKKSVGFISPFTFANLPQSGEMCKQTMLDHSLVSMGLLFYAAMFNAVCMSSSVQRSVYKDIVLLLQKEKYLTLRQLRSKVSDVSRTNIYLVYILIEKKVKLFLLLFVLLLFFFLNSM